MSPELVAEELYKDSILTLEMKETILMQLLDLQRIGKCWTLYQNEDNGLFIRSA